LHHSRRKHHENNESLAVGISRFVACWRRLRPAVSIQAGAHRRRVPARRRHRHRGALDGAPPHRDLGPVGAGASGVIGTEIAAKAPPDGYTLFMGTLGNFTANQYLYAKMPVDPLRDFAPLSQVVAVHFVMVAHPSLPARNVKELIALAKAHPGKINYSSSGPGGAPHLGMELFKSMAGVNLVHIPYKGSGPSFVDLLAGQVSLTCDSLLQALPYIKAGRLRALAVLGTKRTSLLPDVPTVSETVRGYDLTNWFGLAVPAATPRELVNRIYADAAKVMQQADFKERISNMGADVVGSTPEQFGAFMKSESAKWGKVIREAHIRAE
jgi:tripartite-type tricarboxylate transporter receptor subunit TctC